MYSHWKTPTSAAAPLKSKFLSVAKVLLVAISTWRVSALELPPEHVEFFESKIRPVLAESCYECHNSVNKTKAGLALDYRDALLAGSDAGEVVVPGKPEDSALICAGSAG